MAGIWQWHGRVVQYLKSKEDFSEGFCLGFFPGPESPLFHCLRKVYFKLKHNLFKLECVRGLERISTQYTSQSHRDQKQLLWEMENMWFVFKNIISSKNFRSHCLGIASQLEFWTVFLFHISWEYKIICIKTAIIILFYCWKMIPYSFSLMFFSSPVSNDPTDGFPRLI